MAQTKLQQKLDGAIKRMSHRKPWDYLDKNLPYDPNLYAYPLRKGTMPPAVRPYAPFIEAASLYAADPSIDPLVPFRLCEKVGIQSSKTYLEAEMPDGTSFLVLCERSNGTYKLRVSIVETDGTRMPALPFKDMSLEALTCVCMALWPDILTIDADKGNGKLVTATNDLGKAVAEHAATPWNSKNEIPDYAKEAAYMLDAVMSLSKDEMHIDCGNDTSDTPAEIDSSYFATNGTIEAKLICENFGVGIWMPKVLVANGKAKKRGKVGIITIAAAKDEYGIYSAHRKWTAQEQALIPSFPDNMPVMPQVIYMARRIVNTRNDTNPIVTGMWRGSTGIGKTTGMRQLACILNRPYLTQTCHPSMEAQDLKSMFVPATELEDDMDEDTGMIIPTTPATTGISLGTPVPTFDYAYSYITSLEPDKQKEILQDKKNFFDYALMDQEEAETMLFGCAVGCELPDLLAIYADVRDAFVKKSYEAKMEVLKESVKVSDKDSKHNGPEFRHVLSPYVQALSKGYVVEIQEASRVRDSGVMVSTNDYDKPGARIQLANGGFVTRHKEAISVITDNVGYASCRPIDPSVIRRQGFIIDSDELPKEDLIARVKYNTGVTDENLLSIAYNLWAKTKEYCDQNSINEGSVSPVELERFVQALKYDGMDSIAENLDNCIISKATSSMEDQREIRSVCSVLIPAM